jgi:hypothetical protein
MKYLLLLLLPILIGCNTTAYKGVNYTKSYSYNEIQEIIQENNIYEIQENIDMFYREQEISDEIKENAVVPLVIEIIINP